MNNKPINVNFSQRSYSGSYPDIFIEAFRFLLQLSEHTAVNTVTTNRIGKIKNVFSDRPITTYKFNNNYFIIDNDHLNHQTTLLQSDGVTKIHTINGPNCPQCLLDKLPLSSQKTIEYYFIGINYPKQREKELKPYQQYCEYTGHRENQSLFDTNYWGKMLHTKFALCPSGTCKWTYRFYEAILAYAIPYISPQHKETMPEYCHQFHYYVFGDKPTYDVDIAIENRRLLLEFNRKQWEPLIKKLKELKNEN